MVLFEERAAVLVSDSSFFDPTALTLPGMLRGAELRTVGPLPLARRIGGRTAKVVAVAIPRKLGIVMTVFGGVSAAAIVREKVALVDGPVGVVHADRGTLRGLLHAYRRNPNHLNVLATVVYASGVESFFTIPRCSRAVRIVHETADEARTLAPEVELAEGIVSQGLGLMFRRSIPDNYALVFPFSDVSKRGLHMVFVPFDIDAIWLVDGTVEATKRLAAWTGYGRAAADTVIEMPAGTASAASPGDEIRIEGLRQ